MANLYLYGTRFTEGQRAIIQRFAKERGLERPREILQAICKAYFEGQGVTWPADYPQWGGKRPKKAKT